MKKMIAPIIATILSVAVQVAYAALFIGQDYIPIVWQIVVEVILAGTVLTSIWVLIERIKEIQKGETDDLSKY